MGVDVIEGDCRKVLATLPAQSVHCVVTSPPYYLLRNYGVDGQIGQETTFAEYVETLVGVFREVWRVLRDDGVCWLNIGDSYASTGGHTDTACTDRRAAYRIGSRPEHANRNRRVRGDGAAVKIKDMYGIPWRVAFALQEAGWFLRADCIWHKTNALPGSMTDRPVTAHEYVFLLSKRPRYFYDRIAVMEKSVSGDHPRRGVRGSTMEAPGQVEQAGITRMRSEGSAGTPAGAPRNLRSVWTISTQPFPEAHFATFPPALAARCVRAGTSERGCCPECGVPWRRVLEERKERGDWRAGRRDKDSTEGLGANALGGEQEWDHAYPVSTQRPFSAGVTV